MSELIPEPVKSKTRASMFPLSTETIKIVAEISVVIILFVYFTKKNGKLVKHISVLSQRLEDQDDEIDALKNKMAEVSNMVEELSDQVQKLKDNEMSHEMFMNSVQQQQAPPQQQRQQQAPSQQQRQQQAPSQQQQRQPQAPPPQQRQAPPQQQQQATPRKVTQPQRQTPLPQQRQAPQPQRQAPTKPDLADLEPPPGFKKRTVSPIKEEDEDVIESEEGSGYTVPSTELDMDDELASELKDLD